MLWLQMTMFLAVAGTAVARVVDVAVGGVLSMVE